MDPIKNITVRKPGGHETLTYKRWGWLCQKINSWAVLSLGAQMSYKHLRYFPQLSADSPVDSQGNQIMCFQCGQPRCMRRSCPLMECDYFECCYNQVHDSEGSLNRSETLPYMFKLGKQVAEHLWTPAADKSLSRNVGCSWLRLTNQPIHLYLTALEIRSQLSLRVIRRILIAFCRGLNFK